MIDRELLARIRHLFHAEHWKIGTIADHLGLHWETVRQALQTDRFNRRALDCVSRNKALYLTTTINPEAGPDAGQATAHWFQLDTSSVLTSASPAGLITLADQGNIGGEDIAPDTTTFFPSVAVNRAGDVKFGFSASAATIFADAFATGRRAADPPGTVRPSETIKAGKDSYIRTFGGSRNRWGDYSGISVDPTNDSFFWVFNEFADLRGTLFLGEDGRWGTAWGRCKFRGSGKKAK